MADENKKKNPYQDTLNLPKTDFSIRANAAIKEPELLQKWEEEKLYAKSWDKNQGGKKFVFHDGPPYANGHVHLGSALNKIYKDFVTKFWRMMGFHVPVKPGWDCHGLPIELKVEVEHKNEKCDKVAFKKKCREFADKWIDIQRKEFKDLGVVMDWDNPYITMDPSYEADILRAFSKFVDGGYIERKGKSVPWCASCQTVLAAAEIEYKERKDPSIYILFSFSNDVAKKVFPDVLQKNPKLEVNFLIWTTTPWTLALNRAVTLNSLAKYVLLQSDKPNMAFIVAKDLADKVCNVLEIEKKILAEFDSKLLEGQKVNHPFVDNLQVPIILDKNVLLDEGTACVHIAPGCGPQDYMIGVKNNLEIFSPLSADGKYTKGIEPKELEGMSIEDGQIWAIKKLAEKERLLHKTSIRHSYPHCWRCHNPLMFRATDQWFCDLQKNDLVKSALKEIDKIKFIPDWGRTRFDAFVSNRTEWCISRQRMWGVPIPAILCKKCDHEYLTSDFVEKIAARVEKEGVEFWDKISIKQMFDDVIIPKDFKCEKCGNADLNEFKKESDILDVWLESGVSHYAVLSKDKKNLGIPADMYLEGSDQHRGWFQSSLLSSMVLNDQTCTKQIVTHGFILDEKGRKMSKSLGNVIAPDEVIKKYSRDIIRLWVASSDYHSDIAISETILRNCSEVYRKIRNTCRFLISNLYDFDIKKDAIAFEKLLTIDQYALANLYELNSKIIADYKECNFASVYHALNNYCANDLSSLYLDVCKDRLYVEKPDGHLRRSAQTAMFHILDTITHLMAPMLSFLSEEVFSLYQKDKKESIHLQKFVDVVDIWNKQGKTSLLAFEKALQPYRTESPDKVTYAVRMREVWNFLEQLREIVLKAIEEKRAKEVVKHSLEAKVKLYLDPKSEQKNAIDEFCKILKESKEDAAKFFKDWLIVSQFEFAENKDGLSKTDCDWIFVSIEHADGVKCPRCWQWEVTEHETQLCSRCRRVLEK